MNGKAQKPQPIINRTSGDSWMCEFSHNGSYAMLEFIDTGGILMVLRGKDEESQIIGTEDTKIVEE